MMLFTAKLRRRCIAMFRAKRSLSYRALLLLCALIPAASLLHADDFWKSKPRSEWSLKQTMKLLEDSPWARQETRLLARTGGAQDSTYDENGNRCGPQSRDAAGRCPTTPRDRSLLDPFSGLDEVVFLLRWESSAQIEDAFA